VAVSPERRRRSRARWIRCGLDRTGRIARGRAGPNEIGVIVGDARRESSRLYGSGRLRADAGFRYDSLAAEPASCAPHPAHPERQAATSIEWTSWHS